LPGGEIRVLHRQRGQFGHVMTGGRPVEPAQLLGEHPHGGAVGDDVVLGQQQNLVVRREADQ
jgi:hypothetical protein